MKEQEGAILPSLTKGGSDANCSGIVVVAARTLSLSSHTNEELKQIKNFKDTFLIG